MAQDDADPVSSPADASAADAGNAGAGSSAAARSAGPGQSAAPSASTAGPRAGSASNWQGKRVGHFRIVGFLGRGAMGRVFRAEDLRLKRHVALKVFPTIVDQGKRKVRLERFIREARSAAALDHPGIVRVYEADEFRGWYYIAQELVEGGTVGRLIEANGPFDVARACQIGAEVGEALEFAHDHGVIHRDVKPDNIMLARGGRAKLADFGLAFRSDPNDQFHVVDEAVGTAFFMAPEICQGHGATPLSDQYSLAATVWSLLTGSPPFGGSTREEVIRQQVNAPVPSLRQFRPDVPQGLAKAIERGLAKAPEERYPMCEQFAKVLRVYTIGGPATSASASGVAPIVVQDDRRPAAGAAGAMPFWKRKEAIYVAAGVGGLVLLGGIIALATRGGKEEPTPTIASNPSVLNTTPPPRPAPAPAATPQPQAQPPAQATGAVDGDTFAFAGFGVMDHGLFYHAPDASGSTIGILKGSALAMVRDPQRGLVQKLALKDDPAKTNLPDGTDGWFVRHITGVRGVRADNTPRPTTGYVGFWLKTTAPGLYAAIALDNEADKTADRGRRQPVTPDGEWHLYQWNLEDPGQWEPWIEGDGKIDADSTFTVDSIQFWGPNADAEVLLDDVMHNAKGPLADLGPAAQP